MDKETFVRQMAERADSLYRVAWAILGNDADVADALQETALRAWQHRGSLRQQAYFGTWYLTLDMTYTGVTPAMPDVVILTSEKDNHRFEIPITLK